MTEKTLAPPISRWLHAHAGVMLTCCGVVAIWIGPTVWLHERQHATIREVATDLSAQQRADHAEVTARMDHLSSRMDDLILLLGGDHE